MTAPFETISSLAKQLDAGHVSSRELVEDAIVRTERLNQELNAVIALDKPGALAAAEKADKARAATAAAEPPEDPPGTRLRSHGFFTAPKKLVSFDEPMANSSILHLPRLTMPASSSFFTTVAS